MALIKCRDCGKEISVSAETCPNCGCQTVHGKTKTQAKGVSFALVVSLLAFLVGLFLVMSNIGTVMEKYDNDRYWKYNDEASAVMFQFAAGIGLIVGSAITDCIYYKKAKEIQEAEKQQKLIGRLVDQPHYHYHSSPPIAGKDTKNNDQAGECP